MNSFTERGKEESMNLIEKETNVEIMHTIDSNRCEIYVHALSSLSKTQTLKIS